MQRWEFLPRWYLQVDGGRTAMLQNCRECFLALCGEVALGDNPDLNNEISSVRVMNSVGPKRQSKTAWMS